MEHLKLSEQQKQTIVVAGKHAYVLEKIETILSEMGFKVLATTHHDEVLRLLKSTELDGFFLGGGLDPLAKSAYLDYLLAHKPGTKIIDHQGGPANIRNEVIAAFNS